MYANINGTKRANMYPPETTHWDDEAFGPTSILENSKLARVYISGYNDSEAFNSIAASFEASKIFDFMIDGSPYTSTHSELSLAYYIVITSNKK